MPDSKVALKVEQPVPGGVTGTGRIRENERVTRGDEPRVICLQVDDYRSITTG
ncbi:hypothetical protein DDI_0752 [Dickeya dianthicola RNS04.9]|nr:hypothetical protein DDI_0752 [Dickeya dianthicola RNS04.9]